MTLGLVHDQQPQTETRLHDPDDVKRVPHSPVCPHLPDGLEQLVELAARTIGRFLRADNNNLKYLGITALTAVVAVSPIYAAEHQMVVIECLDDPDETLKRRVRKHVQTVCAPTSHVQSMHACARIFRACVRV